jgi:hypothetical protein
MRLTESFEGIRAIVLSDLALQREVLSKPMEPVPESVTSVRDPQKRAQAVQAWLQASPSARRRFEIHQQVGALDLTIVDETGTPIQAWLISIAQIPPRPFEPWMRPDFERAGFRGDPPFFMACAALKPPAILSTGRDERGG